MSDLGARFRSRGEVFRLHRGIVAIGNAHGRIALYLDEQEAIDLAHHFGSGDLAYDELLAAVEVAYPRREPS